MQFAALPIFAVLLFAQARAAEAYLRHAGNVRSYGGLRPGVHHYGVPSGRGFDGRVIRPRTPRYSAREQERATILAVQRALSANGYRPGPHDGRFGPATRRSVIAFQATEDLPVTGKLDGILLSALGVKMALATK